MRYKWVFAILLFALPLAADDNADLKALLDTFLAGAGRNDAAVHDRFWADDLIYTGSSGRRIGKADIMKDVRAAPPAKPSDPVTVYSSEDVRIQLYGTTAVVAFRLMATGPGGVSKYLNSGTFLKRNGEWRVVNWQATKMPRPEDETKKDIAAAATAFQQATSAEAKVEVYGDAAVVRDGACTSTVVNKSGTWKVVARSCAP